MENEQEEKINIKNPVKNKKYKISLTLFQKFILIIIFIFLLIILYNINILAQYLIKDISEYYKSPIKNIQVNNTKENYNNNNKTIIIPKNSKGNTNIKKKKENIVSEEQINLSQSQLEKEKDIPILFEINKKRTFEKRYPLPQEIKCEEHLRAGGLLDMMVFTSFLTKNTTFFEFASGCSSIIAKYYCKKSYAVEGNKKWYDIGVENGLEENLLFRDLKCDGTGPLLSWPGKKSTIHDWKNFIQAYKEDYNADVIFIDGRFRVACAFDVFNKIKNDTVVLLHEYKRENYSIMKKYYDLIYHWGTLGLYQKKKNISEIPLDIQQKYWNEKV